MSCCGQCAAGLECAGQPVVGDAASFFGVRNERQRAAQAAKLRRALADQARRRARATAARARPRPPSRPRALATLPGPAELEAEELPPLEEWTEEEVDDFAAQVGAGLARGAPREVRAVDDVLSSIWSAVRPIVPGGEAIDVLHRARRELMYGPEGGAADLSATVRALQALTRAAARGERAATAELAALKRNAASSPDARRRWKAAVAVMRDDDQRIETAYGRSLGGAR